MQTVTINTSRRYDIRIERGILSRAGEEIRAVLGDVRVMIVTDDKVNALYAPTLEASLTVQGIRFETFVIPHGEASKNAQNWLALQNALAGAAFTRTDALIALGGGVVGDLTGFAAATFLRGIPYIGIPTTLLAMVDSSVGGKTAIDLDAGKNLAGAFHHPSLVLCDPDTLATLSADVFSDGMAEVIKYGVLGDADLFAMLKHPDTLPMEEIIRRCAAMKAAIVEEDEHDHGRRKLLNFGHTAGHAIEARANFTMLHGHGVAAGMVIAARYAHARGLCDAIVIDEIIAVNELYGLPTKSPYPVSDLCPSALCDKKREGTHIDLVLPNKIGECVLCRIGVDELSAFLSGGAV